MDGMALGPGQLEVKDTLAKFIHQQTGHDTLSAIDEIVLSYVVSILETLGGPDDDGFNVDEFSEMMAAYIPAFANINSTAVCDWMYGLSSSMTQKESHGNSVCDSDRYMDLLLSNSPGVLQQQQQQQQQQQLQQQQIGKRSRNTSSCSSEDDKLSSDDSVSEQSEDVSLLCEMFPQLSVAQVHQTLSLAEGDCQRAAQVLLMQHQHGDGSVNHLNGYILPKHNLNPRQDKQLRDQILNRYAYIDKDDDVREHRPVPPKSEPKKLIRYRDNKIVSVKGERYSEVKGEESEDLKKTYVTIKPARNYRFH